MSPLLQTGDIWLAALDPTVGSEIQKTWPCVVISPNEMHQHLRTVSVAPMTTGSRSAVFRIPLTFQGKQGLILLDQIRTLDKQRLIQRVGAVQASTLTRTLKTLQDMFEPAPVKPALAIE
ncbi:type II toxin-antitoxin system PemK/MazF family toxin [Limnohabitans sp. T6-5]|uniref:type II toxin-antitoxin system PemK/MazF family toxin n=1 Tax=Limnohabitans sp. T6-5 TaxID=1100724 RepID=UPI001E282CA2|nr:type II toxin-antitoxin system PemK/MazF family toxin [Limnohabitans sp. T6-5]